MIAVGRKITAAVTLVSQAVYIFGYIYFIMLCYVRIYCCKSDHVRLLCSQSAMAYNSVDRCQLKTGTRPFPLLRASAVCRISGEKATKGHARGAVVFVSICAYLRARAPLLDRV